MGGEKQLSRKIIGILTILLAIAVIALPISSVCATKPVNVSGTFSAGVIPVPVKFAGNNIIFEHSGTGAWTGDITGDSIGVHRWVSHANGITNVRVELTFPSATVLGESGTLYILFLGKITGPGVGEGTWRIIGGAGDLANLHGGGTWSPGQYEGQVHFDP